MRPDVQDRTPVMANNSDVMSNEEDIFAAAIEIADGVERRAYLDEACGTDRRLRASVEELLALHDTAGDFLETPVLGGDDEDDDERAGAVIGRYRLLERIGPDTRAVIAHSLGTLVAYNALRANPQVEVDITRHALQPGDRLLLCSDGLWEMVRDPQITALLEETPDVWEACERLIQAANEQGGHDNITAIVVRVW